MKACSVATAALLANPPPGMQTADLFTFTLADQVTIYRWTSYDVDLLVNGDVYSSKKPWLERSRWGLTNTMTVPTLEVSLKALNDAFAGGADIKAQLTNGLFDGATATLDRVFFAAGTTIINDQVLIVTDQVVITTTGAGSINFATDPRFTVAPHILDVVNNTVEIIAGGGNGAAMTGNGNGVKGGGGGQYGVITGFNPAGGTINFQIGAGGGSVGTAGSPGTADSWFSSAASTLYAQGGISATNGVAGGSGNSGGHAAAVGSSTVANGGDSGGSGLTVQGNSGGGGAGGPNGAGSNGQTTPGTNSGGFGGNGDGNNVAGGLAVTSTSAANPGYTESLYWGIGLVGPGSGGSGAGTASGAPGGAGGKYGGGGGGGQTGTSAGAPGALVISWGHVHAGIRLFGGNVANIDITGNVATINIKGKNNLLDQEAPRNLYQLGCQHAFCDTGCTLARATYTTSYTVGSGSGGPTKTFIPWSSAPGNAANYRYGTVKFTSGVCSGQSRTVRLGDATGLTLISPLHGVPSAGDSFTAFEGCDKQLSSGSGQDCTARSNTQNWRAYPYVPPADSAA